MRYIEACKCGWWHLQLWKKSNPGERKYIPYRCRSWRHEGECALWRGAQDFRRCSEAIKSRDGWLYVVLTYAHAEWSSQTALYKAGVTHWAKLRKRLARECGSRVEYIQTWERHKSGWPHVNVCLHNDELIKNTRGDLWKRWRKTWLGPAAVACGFGRRVWVEPVRSQAAMAGYLVKLARELTGATAKDQTPINAPRHFRRLRASQGLLPERLRDEDLTGRLVQSPMDRWVALTDAKTDK